MVLRDVDLGAQFCAVPLKADGGTAVSSTSTQRKRLMKIYICIYVTGCRHCCVVFHRDTNFAGSASYFVCYTPTLPDERMDTILTCPRPSSG